MTLPALASLPAVLPRVAVSEVASRMSSTIWKARPSSRPTARRASTEAGRRAGAEAAHRERGLDHRGGFVQVDELEAVAASGAGALLGEEVLHLAADQPAAAGGVGELGDERGGERGRGA